MMKKKIAILAAILCVLVLGIVGATWATDNVPTVIFDADKKEFSFQNCQKYTYGDEDNDGVDEEYPDLFPSEDGAPKVFMPGDSFKRTIKVKVINAGNDTVKMYLRSEVPKSVKLPNGEPLNIDRNDNEKIDYDDLFNSERSFATLSATFGEVGATKESILDKAKDFIKGRKDETITSSDTNKVYLGAFTGSSKDREVDVTFKLPLEAGNEYANLNAVIDWVFVAEIIPKDPGGGVTPAEPPVEEMPFSHEDSRGTWNVEVEDYHMAYVIGSDDGLVHPENSITRAEAVTIFFRLMTDACREYYWQSSNHYYDVAFNDWYNNAISTMTYAGIITGYEDGSFRPNDPITRAEFVTIVSRVVTAKSLQESSFVDVSDKDWFKPYVDNAVSLGIITGYEDGAFRPNEKITRAEVMAICNRLMGRLPRNEKSLLENMIRWADNMDKEKWYYLDVQEATNSHLHELEGEQVLYKDREYWIQIDPYIEWEKLERPDSTATNMYQSNQPVMQGAE